MERNSSVCIEREGGRGPSTLFLYCQVRNRVMLVSMEMGPDRCTI